MLKVNIRKSGEALKTLNKIKDGRPSKACVKFINVHLIQINKIIESNVFNKNDLYVSNETLWEIMQPVGNKWHHHSHGLTSEDVLEAIQNIKNSNKIVFSYMNRLLIISTTTIKGEIGVVIEPNVNIELYGLKNINKMITMYQIKK